MNVYNVHQKALDRYGPEASFVGVLVSGTEKEAARASAQCNGGRASEYRVEIRNASNNHFSTTTRNLK